MTQPLCILAARSVGVYVTGRYATATTPSDSFRLRFSQLADIMRVRNFYIAHEPLQSECRANFLALV